MPMNTWESMSSSGPYKTQEKGLADLVEFIEYISEELKTEGMPVDSNCRINADEFTSLHSPTTLSADREKVRKKELEWGKDKKEAEFLKYSEQLEMLTTAIFYKNLYKDFMVMRTSKFDDYFNHVDNVIIDRENGMLVCAFDEISATSGEKYEEKTKRVLELNKSGGAELKYGLRLDNEKNIQVAWVKNAPIFKIALNPEFIKLAIRKFNPIVEQETEFEKRLFGFFMTNIKEQAKELLRMLEVKLKVRQYSTDPYLASRVQKLKTFQEIMVKKEYFGTEDYALPEK